MRRSILIFLTLGMCFGAYAQGVDYHAEAEKLNYKVSFLMEQLSKAVDSTYYYNTLQNVISTAVECEELDSKPNKKGKVKPVYLHHLKGKTASLRERLINGAVYFYRHRNGEKALGMLDLYMQSAASPIYKNHPQNGIASYYAARMAYRMKDYERANKYADMALYEPEYAQRAANVKVSCMRQTMRSKTDSSKYVIALLELHDKDPHNQSYLAMLMDYFMSSGHEAEMIQFAKDEVRKYPNSKQVWEFKGEAEMLRHNWSDAIGAFQRAADIDSLYVPAVYNMGICHSSEAQQLKDSLEKDHKWLKKDEVKQLREMFLKSKEYLERAQRLDPQQHTVQWAAPLYQVLYALDDERADDIKSQIKPSKQ